MFRQRIRVYVLPTSRIPFKKREQDAGFDFFIDIKDSFPDDPLIEKKQIFPREVVKFSTGCIVEFPEETMWLWDVRSSAGLLGLDVTCRTIDNQFRGVLSVVLVNNGEDVITVEHGQRIAQLIPNPFSSKYYFEQVFDQSLLGKTSRGELGFGSSGKN